MSQLLIKTLCQSQATRRLSVRLLSTNGEVNNHASIAPEHNDLKGTHSIKDPKLFKLKHLEEPRYGLSYLGKQPIEADPILLTKRVVEPVKVDLSNIEPVEEADNKVLTSIDVVDKENKASLDQLNQVADYLTRYLPHFFSSPHPLQLYSKDLVLIDRTRSMRTQGLGAYTLQIALIKIYYTLNFTSNKLELLNLVKDPEESCVKIRWRIVSKPGLFRFMLTFYKYHNTELWKDAISTLYINKEGKIYCHVCDNIDVEKDASNVKKVVKNPLVDRGIHV